MDYEKTEIFVHYWWGMYISKMVQSLPEGSMTGPQKLKIRLLYWSNSPTYEYVPKEGETPGTQIDACTHAEAALFLINKRVKQAAAHVEQLDDKIYQYIHIVLFSLKRKEFWQIYNMDEPWDIVLVK